MKERGLESLKMTWENDVCIQKAVRMGKTLESRMRSDEEVTLEELTPSDLIPMWRDLPSVDEGKKRLAEEAVSD